MRNVDGSYTAVLEAAVIGKEDEDDLIKTKASVVLTPGPVATEAELKGLVKKRLAPCKYPLHRARGRPAETATGKTQRLRLRERSATTRVA